ncbi:LOW QUALITY PROTEIN: negative regulator of P-body association [Echinops telfairi]|uniref:LOW QUALITY PROTEIN: negative regulator of P-body association n=1 Tax=Echinops telfairi TaxID=9371 RepID=A0ABM1VK14_ECHTE|nr:LOW QUALITY PROTEIN: negative regulator of P-body association [Echinops telfairi]
MGDQPCASGRSTFPLENTGEAKPPKKHCLFAPRRVYPEFGTPNRGCAPLLSAPPPESPVLKSNPPREKY